MSDERMEVATAKLPKQMLRNLLQMAKQEHRPVSAMIRMLLDEAMQARAKRDKK